MARKRKGIGTTATLVALCEAQNWRCCYCGVRFLASLPCRQKQRLWNSYWTQPTKEHVIPRAQGGTDAWENLVAACFRCNQFRGAEGAMEFYERRGWIVNADDRRADRCGRLAHDIRRCEPVVDVMRLLYSPRSQFRTQPGVAARHCGLERWAA